MLFVCVIVSLGQMYKDFSVSSDDRFWQLVPNSTRSPFLQIDARKSAADQVVFSDFQLENCDPDAIRDAFDAAQNAYPQMLSSGKLIFENIQKPRACPQSFVPVRKKLVDVHDQLVETVKICGEERGFTVADTYISPTKCRFDSVIWVSTDA